MRFDLVALDLDGTLLGPDEQVSPANREAVTRVLESGVRVVIVTGRGTDLPIRLSRELGLNMPVICCHGALVKDFHAGRTLVHIPVPAAAARTIVEVAQAFRIPIVPYIEERYFYLPGTPQAVLDMLGPEAEVAETFDDLLVHGGPPTFLRLFGEGALDVVQRRLADLPIGFFHFDPVLEHDEVAIVSREANKRNALMRLCADFQIPAERVFAIGDSRSDVPMLRWAGLGVAMGNAPADVKAAADFVAPSNGDDGVAFALERFVRLERKKLA